MSIGSHWLYMASEATEWMSGPPESHSVLEWRESPGAPMALTELEGAGKGRL